ncbi:ABC transporter substrate-binding protein [Hominifimenecus sp. rT4P-3]|uniref:ABC transporter substrate-binding protein n=1 Tax=Hominifimenecus sp. rT4P-3 TaxID=3242979 RepID=UPI003DA6C0EC
MKLRKMVAWLMAFTMCMGILAGCKEDTGEAGESAEATEAVTEAPTTEAPTTAAVPIEDQTLIVGSGEFQQLFMPLYVSAEGDQTVVDLTQAKLLTLARDGSVVANAASGATLNYKGKDYSYTGLADISEAYDEASNITTYTVKLKDGVYFSDGTAMTADDIIFTYYVLCDASYDGNLPIKALGILGVEAYQKNNSAAPGVSVSGEEISAALEAPSEELKNTIIESITRPVLQEERAWCEANWEKYRERGYGESAEAFFITLYTASVDSAYNAEGKSFDDIVNDTVNLYGMNYTHLAKNYQGDPTYFDAKVHDITYNFLLNGKMQAAGGTEVPNIEGIRKVDGLTVTISVSGYDQQKIYQLFDVPVLSLDYYGESASYNYDENRFGFLRGDLELFGIKAKAAAPMGAGPYQFVKLENDTVYLEANPFYYKGVPATPYVQVKNVEEEIRAASVMQGKIDLAVSSLTSSTLTQAGAGEVWDAVLAGVPYYSYIGMNASAIKVGAELDSEQSVALRTALALVLAANRAEMSSSLGESAKVLQYPALDGSWTVLTEGQEGFKEAYSLKTDGSPIFTADMTPEARTSAAVEAAKEQLRLAGFTYDEATGMFTAAPEGAKLTYQILVPPYFSGDNPMTALLNRANETLNTVGMGLEIVALDDSDDFNNQMASGAQELWCAERVVGMEPDLFACYHSGNGYNYYGAHGDIDNLIAEAERTSDFAARRSLYQQCYDRVLALGLEVPYYQRQRATLFHIGKIEAGSYAGAYTTAYSWMEDVHLISLTPKA